MAVFNLVSVAIPESPTSKLSKFQAFVLTLMKLRLDVSNYDLGFRFGISVSAVSRVFSKWIEAIDICLSFLITWPDQENLRKSMPFCFRPNYGLKVTSIIDCFELFIEKPSNLLAKSCTWSQYKHYNTAKYLIAIMPQGIVSFVSYGWEGRVSDKRTRATSNIYFRGMLSLPIEDLMLKLYESCYFNNTWPLYSLSRSHIKMWSVYTSYYTPCLQGC